MNQIIEGEITEEIVNEFCYSFLPSIGSFLIKIPFGQLVGVKLITGDIIQIEVDASYHFVRHLRKVTNVYLEELRALKATKQRFLGYVYGRNRKGFLVSYKGYSCFLPINAVAYNIKMKTDKFLISNEIMHKTLEFEVFDINYGVIYLSRISIDKESKQQKIDKEIAELKVGQQFRAKIAKFLPFGIVLSNDYSQGLMHVTETFYFISKSKKLVQKVKNNYQELVQSVFKLGDQLFVTVTNISDGKYGLTWDVEHELNKKYWQKLMDIIHTNKRYQYLKRYYYPPSDIIRNVSVGDTYEVMVDRITPFGLLVKVKNLTGLLHLSCFEEFDYSEQTSIEFLQERYEYGNLVRVVVVNIEGDRIGFDRVLT